MAFRFFGLSGVAFRLRPSIPAFRPKVQKITKSGMAFRTSPKVHISCQKVGRTPTKGPRVRGKIKKLANFQCEIEPKRVKLFLLEFEIEIEYWDLN